MYEINPIKEGKILQQEDISEVYEENVKPVSEGAMIQSAKKYVGKRVCVIVRPQD